MGSNARKNLKINYDHLKLAQNNTNEDKYITIVVQSTIMQSTVLAVNNKGCSNHIAILT